VFCRWAALATVLGKVPDLPVAAREGYTETLPEALRGRLPENKFELYDPIVDYVLYNRYPESAGDRRRVRERLGFIAAGMHTGEDLGEARETPEPEASHAQLERLLRAFGRESPSTEKGVLDVAERLHELLSDSGLLLPREGKRAGFYHFSYQEFLAAERLAVGTGKAHSFPIDEL
jgi:hypothetical protein